MSIKIVVSNTVKFKVKGTLKDEAGVDQPFDFTLTCMRLNADQVREKLQGQSDALVAEFMSDVIEDWSGVRGDDDKPVPYSEAALKELFNIPGVALLAFNTYLLEIGAKAKN